MSMFNFKDHKKLFKSWRRAGMFLLAALLAAAMAAPASAGNDPDTEDRNSGYYPTDVEEYPELSVIYEGVDLQDQMYGFEDKQAMMREREADHLKYDSDSMTVSCREFETDNHRVILTHILVRDPGSQVKAGLSNDTFGGEQERTTSFARRTGAVVAVNGSYFYYGTGKPIDICAPVVFHDGEILRDGGSNGSEICLRFDGSFFSPHPNLRFDSQTLLSLGVVSSFGTADPLLISDGMPMSFPAGVTDSVYPRTAIGVVFPGDYYLITAGYDGSYSGGLSYKQMQSIFYHLGCSYARSFDGGGSATLVINGDLVNVPAAGYERKVVDFLAFYSLDE